MSLFKFALQACSVLILTGSLAACAAAESDLKQSEEQQREEQQAEERQDEQYSYAHAAFGGDLSTAEADLMASSLPSHKEVLEKFRARFIKRTDIRDYSDIEDEALREVALLYQDYWIETLLDPERRPEQELALLKGLRVVVDKYENAAAADAVISLEQLEELKNNPAFSGTRGAATLRLEDWLEGRGHSLLLGRTAPLLDFMLWRNTNTFTKSVEITDGVEDVTVHHLSDFISRGWQRFAVLEYYFGVGGWTNDGGIFTVVDGFDVTSEKYELDLKHEARHHADLKYKNLSADDLEYRAKLTELAFASETLENLLAVFTSSADRNSQNAHQVAGYFVVKHVREELNISDTNAEWWKGFDPNQIRTAARDVLARNTTLLESKRTEYGGLLSERNADK